MGEPSPIGRSANRFCRVAFIIQQRLHATGWLVGNGIEWVTVSTARRVLGVSRARINALIAQGRLKCVEGMPGGSDSDRFLAVADLASLPTPLASGNTKRGTPGDAETLIAAALEDLAKKNGGTKQKQLTTPGRHPSYGVWGPRKRRSDKAL